VYVTPAVISAAEEAYGAPRELHVSYEISAAELAMIRGSQRDGRAHDVTLFVFNGERLAVIAKPSYPPGAYRVPGGSLRRDEAMDAGALREGLEETGLTAQVRHYLLRIHARFSLGDDGVDWTTHVLSATTDQAAIDPIDTREIREARWSSLALSLPRRSAPVGDRATAGRPVILAYRPITGYHSQNSSGPGSAHNRGGAARPGREV